MEPANLAFNTRAEPDYRLNAEFKVWTREENHDFKVAWRTKAGTTTKPRRLGRQVPNPNGLSRVLERVREKFVAFW